MTAPEALPEPEYVLSSMMGNFISFRAKGFNHKKGDGLYTASQLQAYGDARAQAARMEAAGWLPIESAPRDYSKFLAWRRGEVAQAQCFVRDDGDTWIFGSTTANVEVFPQVKPSHWMPLPPPPEDIRALGGKGAAHAG